MSLSLNIFRNKKSTSKPATPSRSPDKPTQEDLSGGVLSIRIVEAKNIAATNGLLPSCVIDFDKNEIDVQASSFNGANPIWKHRAYFDVTRAAPIGISMYVIPSEAKEKEIFLGAVSIPFETEKMPMDQWFPLVPNHKNDRVSGEVHVIISFSSPSDKTLTVEKFDLLKVIGKGSFGKVMQVRKKDTNRIYAMKIIKKADIIERDEVEHTLAERNVLAQINNPFVVNLKFSFQTPEKLYLVLAFVNGGELFFHLQNAGQFDESRARFYISELLCALEHLHELKIIYRDLKPENILVDYNGHISLCDFGLCKLNMKKGDKTNTFCGTPEYLAPEVLKGEGYNQTVDWWTLGVLLYEMITGLPPFYSENTDEMYQKILYDPLKFPDYMSPQSRALLTGLLTRDPTKRLGCNGAAEIKSHPFFTDIDWQKVMQKKYQPPFKPRVASEKDTSNFDEEFTKEVALDSVAEDSQLSQTLQQKFQGFTYNPESALAKEK